MVILITILFLLWVGRNGSNYPFNDDVRKLKRRKFQMVQKIR